MIGVLMTAVALGCAILALAVSVHVLLKQQRAEKRQDVAINDLRHGLQTLRIANEARMIREAETGMTPEQREDTTLK